jgi:hypothetical protein
MSTFSICGLSAGNTGSVDCDPVRSTPAVLIPGSGSFLPANYVDLPTFKPLFIGKLKKANTASDKLFPFPTIQGTTDKTVAAKEGNLGYGLRVVLTRSKAGYEFDVLAGSNLEKRLMKFNNKTLPIYIFDDNSVLWGVTNTGLVFSGAVYLLTVEPRPFADGQNPKTTKISISIVDSKDFTENSRCIQTDFASSDLVGLLDGELYSTAAAVANVYHIGMKIRTDLINSFVNVHDNSIYAAGLAAGGMWVAKTGTNFATTLAITSVTDDPTNGGWTPTFDSTAYTALASGAQIKLNVVDPATLDAAGITGIEGTAIILTKP